MTQEEKELLLKDLCARLPYGVKVDIPDLFVSTKNNIEVLNEIFCGDDGEFRCNDSGMLIKYVKPYLFPLSSMTEKLIHEFYCMFIENDISFEDFVADYWNINSFHKLMTSIDDCGGVVEWFNKNHCDYRGLIEKGLAIDATNLNIYWL